MRKISTRLKAVVLIIALLATFSSGYFLAQAVTSTSVPVYLQDLPSAYSYVVKTDGSGNYWSVKYDGSIPYSSTNIITVLNNTISALPTSGGNIYFQKGVYGSDGQYLDITKDGIHLYGEGSGIFEPYGVFSTMSPPHTAPTRFKIRVAFLGVDGGGIHNIGFEPDAFRTGEAGIFGQHIHFCVFDRVSICGYSTGIEISTYDEVNSYSECNQILYCMIFNVTTGIKLTSIGAGYKAENTQIYGGAIWGYSAASRVTTGINIINADFTDIHGMYFVNVATCFNVQDGPTRITAPIYNDVVTRMTIVGSPDVMVMPNEIVTISMRGNTANNPDNIVVGSTSWVESTGFYRRSFDFERFRKCRMRISVTANGNESGNGKGIAVAALGVGELVYVTWNGTGVQEGLTSSWVEVALSTDQILTLYLKGSSVTEQISIYGVTVTIEQLYGGS